MQCSAALYSEARRCMEICVVMRCVPVRGDVRVENRIWDAVIG